MGNEVVENQVEATEVDDVVVAALEAVDAESGSEAGDVKEAVDTAPTEKEGEVGDLEPEPLEDKPKEDVAVTTTEEKKSGEDEKGESEEEASLEDIMSDGKEAKTDVEKAKDGTPEWLQKRLDEQTRKGKEALEAKDKEIADLREKVIPEKRPMPPVESEYEDKQKYQEAYLKFKDEDDAWKDAKTTNERHVKAAEDRFNANTKKYAVSMKRMQDKYSDFDALVNVEETAAKFYHLGPVLRNTEFAPEIGYHLAKNPEKLADILKMDDVSAILAIGEMVGQCKKSGVKEVTTAPKVLKKVKDTPGGGASDEVSLKDIETISRDYLNLA